MIIAAQSRKLKMREVPAHPLRPLSFALASGDGSLRTTDKTAFARELEKSVTAAEEIPVLSTTIIDGMSVMQKMKGDDKILRSWLNLYWQWFFMKEPYANLVI